MDFYFKNQRFPTVFGLFLLSKSPHNLTGALKSDFCLSLKKSAKVLKSDVSEEGGGIGLTFLKECGIKST